MNIRPCNSPKDASVGALLAARGELPPHALRVVLLLGVVGLVIPGAQGITAAAGPGAAPGPGRVPEAPGPPGLGRAGPVLPPLGYVLPRSPLVGRHGVRVGGSGDCSRARSPVLRSTRQASARVTQARCLAAGGRRVVGVAAGLRPGPTTAAAGGGGGGGGGGERGEGLRSARQRVGVGAVVVGVAVVVVVVRVVVVVVVAAAVPRRVPVGGRLVGGVASCLRRRCSSSSIHSFLRSFARCGTRNPAATTVVAVIAVVAVVRNASLFAGSFGSVVLAAVFHRFARLLVWSFLGRCGLRKWGRFVLHDSRTF